MSDSGRDLRDSERILVNHEFRGVETFLSEYVMNISHSGVFVRSDDPLPVGTRVRLKFTLVLEEIESIEGYGEVVRAQSGPGQISGMGILFEELTPESEQLIERILKEQSEE